MTHENRLPTDELLREHAYLVARGTRAVSLIGECDANDTTMIRTATQLEAAAALGAIPFVVDRKDGVAEYGYGASRWAVDLWEWLSQTEAVPDEHRHRLRGLLLGYSVEAIRMFEEQNSGRRFGCASA